MPRASRLAPRCWLVVCVATLFVLAGCSSSRDASSMGARPHVKVGQPYQVLGQWYHPQNVSRYEAVGVASWYGRKFHGRLTSNGELYDMNAYTAAHPTLPLPSLVEVTNLENGRRMVVRVNDRGPFVKNREIDLSRAAASALGFERQGLAQVHVRLLGPARLEEAIVALNQTPRRWDRPPIVVASGACPPTAAC
jgi:rare lipoprotein A